MATQGVSNLDFERNDRSLEYTMIEAPIKSSLGVFILAVVEAVCVFYVAAAKSGFLLLAAGIATGVWATFLHQNSVRIPLLFLVLAGAALNLFLLWKAHRLRNSPAAAWRQRALTKKERLRIGMVVLCSMLTLALTATEIFFHHSLHGAAF